MSTFKPKITRHTKKLESITQTQKKAVNRNYEQTQILDLTDNVFEADTVNLFKEFKENMFDKLKENMLIISQQIGNLHRKKSYKKNQRKFQS